MAMLVGIGGVSRSGKSSLAERLKAHFEAEGKSVEVFSMDDYVKRKFTLSKVQGYPDWERPSTIRWDFFNKSLEKSTADVKIIEGIFAYYPASLISQYDLKIFMEIDRDTFLKRRKEETRWDDEPEWYPDHVWRSHLKYGQVKEERINYVVLDGTKEVDLQQILDKVPA